jgi:hypothetical protein
MNRGWSKVARGKHEMTDRTKFESIRLLNTALMERLGEVTGQLMNADQEILRLRKLYGTEVPQDPYEPETEERPSEPATVDEAVVEIVEPLEATIDN